MLLVVVIVIGAFIGLMWWFSKEEIEGGWKPGHFIAKFMGT
jgi:hypothetical protein